MMLSSRHTATARIPLGEQGYRPPFTRVVVETRSYAYDLATGAELPEQEPGHVLVIESVSEESQLEAQLNLDEIAGKIIDGLIGQVWLKS